MKGLKNEDHNIMSTMTKIKLILVGANVTYLISTLAYIPNGPAPYFPGSYGLFLLLTIANLYPIGLLLMHSAYQLEDAYLRGGYIFSFFGLQWLSTVAFGFEAVKSGATSVDRALVPLMVVGVFPLIAWIIWTRWTAHTLDNPEKMFP